VVELVAVSRAMDVCMYVPVSLPSEQIQLSLFDLKSRLTKVSYLGNRLVMLNLQGLSEE
jgi:hypothetical protein